MKFKKSILGGRNSIANQFISHPGDILMPPAALVQDFKRSGDVHDAENAAAKQQEDAARLSDQDLLKQTGIDEEARQRALGEADREAILNFGGEFKNNAATQREALAKMLAGSNQDILDQYSNVLKKQGTQAFEEANPYILQDLNARGLATSGSAVNEAQARALKELATQQEGQVGSLAANLGEDTRSRLAGFDTDTFNATTGYSQDALSALLAGNHAGVNSSLEMGRAGLNRLMDLHDQDREERLAKYSANKQSRDQLVGSLIGAGASIGGAAIGGPAGASIGSDIGNVGSSAFMANRAPAYQNQNFGFPQKRYPYQNAGNTLGPVYQ